MNITFRWIKKHLPQCPVGAGVVCCEHGVLGETLSFTLGSMSPLLLCKRKLLELGLVFWVFGVWFF